jgi:membrane associated rhomboid family serine protease
MDLSGFNITTLIIGITVIISWVSFNNPSLVRRFIHNPYLVSTQHQYYRFLSSGFLHGDFYHLLWNMLSLYFFGSVVEVYFSYIFGEYSTWYFISFYLLAIIVSDVPTYFKHKHHPSYNSLGASGGVAAVIFASIIFQPLQNICFYFVICIPGFILGTVYLIWSYYKGRAANDNINHEAHIYGALFGLIFCIVMYPASLVHFFEQLKEWNWQLF